MQNSKSLTYHALILYSFTFALYFTLGVWIQTSFGFFGIFLNEILILLLPSILYVYYFAPSFATYFPIRFPSPKEVLIVFTLTTALILTLEVLLYYQEKIWPLPEEILQFYESLSSHSDWWTAFSQFIVLALTPAICEEMVFRGLLPGLLEPQFGKKMAMVLSAFVFAIVHLNPWHFFYYFLLGLFFGWIRIWKNNLILCILAHFLNNLYSIFGAKLN